MATRWSDGRLRGARRRRAVLGHCAGPRVPLPARRRRRRRVPVRPERRRAEPQLLAGAEGKATKNRLHLDIQASGGRAVPWDERWPLAVAAAERLVRAGATVVEVCEWEGRPDHYCMLDPEGNEFCVL